MIVEALYQKYLILKRQIKRLDGAIVAFSGGVDSALILKIAYDELGDKVIAVTADSASLPRRELEETKKIAERIGAKHLIIETQETENKNYLNNPIDRCYYCKSELYSKLKKIANQLGIKNIINGTNLDDLDDYRPGLQAAKENNVISPLKDVGLKKDDVRELAKHFKLEVWDKPSSPCLSSRIPHNQAITLKKLAMVEEAENILKDLGIRELRVRHFGEIARIEVNDKGEEILKNNFFYVEKRFSQIGFVEIIIQPFKSGSLNLMINVS